MEEAVFLVNHWLQTHSEDSIQHLPYSQPVRIGNGWTKRGQTFSHEDFSGLPVLSLPQLPCDLNQGINAFSPKDPLHKGYIEDVIAAARAAGASLDTCHIVTYRNNLNKIFGTPIDHRAPWTVDGCLLNGTLFLDIVKGEPMEWELTKHAKRMAAWGYQFEAKCTGKVVGNANDEYAMLVGAKLGGGDSGLNLMIGAEIDAFDARAAAPSEGEGGDGSGGAERPPPLSSLRELKTFKYPDSRGPHRTLYRLKHPKWWLQSFLVGVEGLILGERDDDGKVWKIHQVPTTSLVQQSQKEGHRWNPNYLLAFGSEVLTWMRGAGEMVGEQHVRFEYNPERGVIVRTVVAGGDLPGRVRAALS